MAAASKGVAAAEDLADQVSKLAQKEMEAFLRKYLEKLWEQYHVAFLMGEPIFLFVPAPSLTTQ